MLKTNWGKRKRILYSFLLSTRQPRHCQGTFLVGAG